MNMKSTLKNRAGGIIHPNDNAQIDIQRDMDGGALIVVRELNKPPRAWRIARGNVIGMALALLAAANIPIDEAYRRKQARETGNV